MEKHGILNIELYYVFVFGVFPNFSFFLLNLSGYHGYLVR